MKEKIIEKHVWQYSFKDYFFSLSKIKFPKRLLKKYKHFNYKEMIQNTAF